MCVSLTLVKLRAQAGNKTKAEGSSRDDVPRLVILRKTRKSRKSGPGFGAQEKNTNEIME